MKEIIFIVEKDPEGGFNASALGYSIITQGETMAELKNNVRDAIKCHFSEEKDIPQIIRLHFVSEEVFTYA
ncbi:MAG: 2-oxoisovalerate dehydrogenase [Nitrospirae bacterium]|nr:2-oxoisovalerate dehydrogenase [Nitrospirota bacterium]